VVRAMLKEGGCKIRGITGNANSEKAKGLAVRGVEMVNADLNDEKSLVQAFHGASAIFAVTDFYEPFRWHNPWIAMDVEYQHGINMARAALQIPSLQHYIWSTLPYPHKISNKQFFVCHFEAKARVDEFVKSQPALLKKTTFCWITFFISNFLKPTFAPIFNKSVGKHLMLLPTSPSTVWSFAGDTSVNAGVFIRSIIAQRHNTIGGRYVFGSVETISLSHYLERWSTATGACAVCSGCRRGLLQDVSRIWRRNGSDVAILGCLR
jgi:hypothetical protein